MFNIGGNFWTSGSGFGFRLCRGPFWPKNGARKNMILWRKGPPPWGLRGICKRGMDCMVPRRLWGKAVFPQTPPENNFLDLPGFRDQFGGPLGLHGGSLLSLCGPMAYTTPDGPALVGRYVNQCIPDRGLNSMGWPCEATGWLISKSDH